MHSLRKDREKEKKKQKERERERGGGTVLSVVVNRMFEKIASKKLGTSSRGTSNGTVGNSRGAVAKWAGKERV